MVNPEFLLPVAAAAASAGGAWGAIKVMLNGTRDRVKKLENIFELHTRNEQDRDGFVIDRLARLETKLDLLIADKVLK
jgi:hypothetical protein